MCKQDYGRLQGGIAQWLEHLTADQEVPSSTLGAPLQLSPTHAALGWGFVKEN